MSGNLDPGGVSPDAASPRSSTSLSSPLSDGEWHRLHPLTPVFRGGLVVVIVLGIVIANLRERLLGLFLPGFGPRRPGRGPEDPVDYVLDHGLLLLVMLAVILVALVLIGVFTLSWRMHTFRVTAHDVEVRSGMVFRAHRRAPLDRVQGVNLTRPMVARLCGMAKLEVVGAGLDANVTLEYLSTSAAEAVRADILRLAAGAQAPEGVAVSTDAAPPAAAPTGVIAATLSEGITGLVRGAESEPSEPASVVRIPPARLVASHLLSGATISAIIVIVGVIVVSVRWAPPVLIALVPMVIAFVGISGRRIVRALRYSIAPTPHGVRVTFGLLTTVTETLPPGRVHAVEVSQPLLWRAAGWWTVTINRVSGTNHGQQGTEEFTRVLPVGTRADVERVVGLLLPELSEEERALLLPGARRRGDPYTTMPRRAWILRPLSWRRTGFLLRERRLFLRRGRIWRSVAVFPLARAQGVSIHQGPLDRALRVVGVHVRTVAGPVGGGLGGIDRDAGLQLFQDAAARAIGVGESEVEVRA